MFEPLLQFFKSLETLQIILGVAGLLIGMILSFLYFFGDSKWLRSVKSKREELDQAISKQRKTNDDLEERLKQRRSLARNYDWRNVVGVDSKTAGLMQSLGIRDIEHLRGLSSKNRITLLESLNRNGLNWSNSDLDSILSRNPRVSRPAISGSGNVAATGVGVSGFTNESPQSKNPSFISFKEPDFNISLPAVSGPSVDWSTVKGVDPKVAAELKSLGIKNVEQLESLSAADRQKLEARLKSKGLSWDWGWLSSWKTGLAGLAGTAAAGVAGVTGFASRSPETAESASKTNTPAESDFNISLPAVSGPSVDWSTVKGVDPKVAAELKSLGIKNVEQLESLSAADRQKLEARLKSKGLSWDWGWLSSWKTGLAGLAGAAATAMGVGALNRKSDNDDKTISKPTVGAKRDQSELQRHSSAGTGKPQSPEPVFASTTGLDGGGSIVGRGNDRDGDEVKFDLPFSAGPVFDWGQVDGVSPKLAKEFSRLGVKNPQQLAAMSPDQKAKFRAHLTGQGIGWDWRWLDQWGKSDETGKSRDVKNEQEPQGKLVQEKKISGFASALDRQTQAQSSLNQSTLDKSTQRDQGQGASPSRVQASASANLDVASLRGSSQGSAGFGASGSSSENVNPNEAPVLFNTIPEWRDDLTLLDGIDGPQSIELRKMGVYNFDQLHNLSPEATSKLQTWFRRRGWSLDMDQWRIASDGNTLNPSMDDIRSKAYEVFRYREERDLHGGDRTDWDQAEWTLRGNPNFGFGIPHHVDDFAVSLTGVTPEARDELYRMGLYNHSQISELNPEQRRALTKWFAGPRFGIDLTQAFGWLSSLMEIPEHLNFGKVFSSRPAHIDDLSLIVGVEPSTESDLNRIGIYRFQQIVDWDEDNVHSIAEALRCDPRIIFESWQRQAKGFIGS